jgi:hypothetical protein
MRQHSSLTTSELARHLRMSESATESVLRVLAASGDLPMHVRFAPRARKPQSAAPRSAA